jgi:hypothetical protein
VTYATPDQMSAFRHLMAARLRWRLPSYLLMFLLGLSIPQAIYIGSEQHLRGVVGLSVLAIALTLRVAISLHLREADRQWKRAIATVSASDNSDGSKAP